MYRLLMTNTKPSVLLPGTRVHFDGQIGHATPDRHVGCKWDGVTYRVYTPSIFPGRLRMDLAPRSQLTPV